MKAVGPLRRPQLRPALSVWYRNLLAFSSTWRGSLVPTALDPVLYLVGLGFGLGAYVSAIDGVPYRDFVASGLCAAAVLAVASFEATFGVFWRMGLTTMHENMLTTQVEAEDIVLGELLWSATRATLYGTVYLATIAVLGFVNSPWALLMPPFMLLGGLAFAAMGMWFSVLVRDLDYFSYYFILVVNPLFLFGGIFFPLDGLPAWVGALGSALPTVHLVEISRALSGGHIEASVLGHAGWLALTASVCALVPLRLLRRRLIP